MILEVIFWIAFIAASQTIAKIYHRRRDVLYGSYYATTRRRRVKPTIGRAKYSINGLQRSVGGRHVRAPVRLDLTPSRVRKRVCTNATLAISATSAA
jgi:hypothetical protein